jgi:hypothetical protein
MFQKLLWDDFLSFPGHEPWTYLELHYRINAFDSNVTSLSHRIKWIWLWEASSGAKEMSWKDCRWVCGQPTFLALANQSQNKVRTLSETVISILLREPCKAHQPTQLRYQYLPLCSSWE